MRRLLAHEQGLHANRVHRFDASILELDATARGVRVLPSLPSELVRRLLLWRTNPILRGCATGRGGATERPFFHADAQDVTPTIEEFRHAISLPSPVEEAMSFFDANTELYVGKWTIMSVAEMRRMREAYEADSQALVTPFAHRYVGMGHVEVLAWNPHDRVVFKYSDGGSNAYDRRDNYHRVLTLSVDDIRALSVNLCDAMCSNPEPPTCC